MSRLLTIMMIGLLMTTASQNGAEAAGLDPKNTLYLDLESGRITIKLRPDLAPNHVERIKTLTKQGFYDGLKFHRVIGGFMAQTGDPRGNGAGGSDLPDLKAEFTDTPFKRGVLGMARSGHPDSANSQFFITYARQRHLDGQYTVWGEVIDGMALAGKIKRGEPPADPDIIVKMSLAEE